MSIPGKLEIDRANRSELDRRATLRDSAMQPHDILIEDLSVSGCRILLNLDLPIDTLVRVGISGVGTREAKIVRGSQPVFGCAFLKPMSESDVRRAARAETVVPADFPAQPGPPPKREDTGDAVAARDRRAEPVKKRRVPLWVDVVALFLIFLFALHVWGMMPH